MTVNVPCENVEKVGLRKVIDEETVEKVVQALTGDGTTMPKNWNRRFKHNRDKMKTGDIFELAEVVRNLSLRDHEKGLSTGEKQMFVKAKKILVSELMYAKGMDEEETAVWLDDVLAEQRQTHEPAAAGSKKKTAVGVSWRRRAPKLRHERLGRPRRCGPRRPARPGPAQGLRTARRAASCSPSRSGG